MIAKREHKNECQPHSHIPSGSVGDLIGSQVTTVGLLSFDSLKQGLEVTSTETRASFALNDFKENGGSVLDRRGKELEEISLIVHIHKNVQLLKNIKVFLDLRVVKKLRISNFNIEYPGKSTQ